MSALRAPAKTIANTISLRVFGLIAYGFNKVTPRYHAFSLVDLNISHPLLNDTVSTTTLTVVSVLVPAAFIFLVTVLFVPGPQTIRKLSWVDIARIKIWELNSGWLGLALSHVTALLVVQGLKNVVGKPRPDLLARCQPDTSNIGAYTVGGYGQDISPAWVLVTQLICQQPDKSKLNDGFRSFPSGHSSTSFAGLFYLSLYLASKFGVAFPYLASKRYRSTPGASPSFVKERRRLDQDDITNAELLGRRGKDSVSPFNSHQEQASAPPVYLLFLPYIPIGVAMYISGSRYFDYRHHGFDILSGVLVGVVVSTAAFRFYHPRLTRGSGWSWRPRQPDQAFGVAIGMRGLADRDNGTEHEDGKERDIEMGPLSSSRMGNSSLDIAHAQVDGTNPRTPQHPP